MQADTSAHRPLAKSSSSTYSGLASVSGVRVRFTAMSCLIGLVTWLSTGRELADTDTGTGN